MKFFETIRNIKQSPIIKTLRVVNSTIGGLVVGATAVYIGLNYIDNKLSEEYKIPETVKLVSCGIGGIPLAVYGCHLVSRKN